MSKRFSIVDPNTKAALALDSLFIAGHVRSRADIGCVYHLSASEPMIYQKEKSTWPGWGD